MEPSSKPVSEVIGVLIADDHPVVREGLVTILRTQNDMKVLAEAADGKEVCNLCDQLFPDVLLLDLRMPRKDGLQVISELMSRRGPKPGIIVLTTYENEEDIRRALRAGAKSYLAKGTAPEKIIDAVRRVAAGETLYCRRQSRPNLRNQWPTPNSGNLSGKCCVTWPAAEATKR
jgi:DNA-binding NarL/FixJ family response regulator